MGFKAWISPLILGCFAVFLLAGCEENIFESSADKESDEAFLIEAEIALNNKEYDRAILFFESLSATAQANRKTIVKIASAYSGKCGLDFLSFLEKFDSVEADSVFHLLFAVFIEATEETVASCEVAESKLRALGSEMNRTGDENFLVAFNAMAEIGNRLNKAGDKDQDRALDPTFDHCNVSQLPDSDVDQIGSAIALTLNSFSGVGEDLVDVDSFREQCSSIPGFARICNLEDGGFDSAELRLLRAFIGSKDFGVGSCGEMTDGSCDCP